MKQSILILNAGANLRRAYYTNAHDVYYIELPIREIMWRNLDRYDLVIIPSWSDQELLYDFRHKLESFIDNGGVLLQFGCHSLRWFPFLDWEDGCNNEIQITNNGITSGIFAGLNFDLLRWHPEFVSHGSFKIKDKQNTKALAVDEEGKPIIVEVQRGKGKALFCTLDPDFHYVTGSFLKDQAQERISEGLSLLSGFMTWALSNFLGLHGPIRIRLRRIKGYIGFVALYRLALPALFFLTLGGTALAFILDPAARQPGTLASLVFSALGFTLTIAQELRERRMRKTGLGA